VLSLALILLLTFLVLSALLWGGTRLLQGMLYENVESDLLWRAPAAAAAITAYIGVWALFNYAAAEPGEKELPFGDLFSFTTEKVSEQPLEDFWAERGTTKTRYKKKSIAGAVPRFEYRDDTPQENLWTVSRTRDVQAIIVKEGDKEVRFKAVPGEVRYVEEDGRRYLDEEGFGKIKTPRGGGSFVRVLLNVLHFTVWFVCLWLLLRFQWPHALGLAVACWLVMTFVVPFILKQGVEAKGPRPTTTAAIHRFALAPCRASANR
jgi:hypothetical protein